MSDNDELTVPHPVDARIVPENLSGRKPDFLWEGQPRYKCHAGCSFDTYDPVAIEKHERVHQQTSGEVRGAPSATVLFDHLNRPLNF